MSDTGSKFTDLTHEDWETLKEQRGLVLRQLHRCYENVDLFRDERDLAVLQRLIDDAHFLPEQTYELQCLGIVFGDVFESRPEFEWKMVSDEYGRDPTLRYKQTSAQLNVLTMISKRIEDGASVDVARLYEETIRFFEENESEIRE